MSQYVYLSLRELREGITVVDGDDNQLGSSQVRMYSYTPCTIAGNFFQERKVFYDAEANSNFVDKLTHNYIAAPHW